MLELLEVEERRRLVDVLDAEQLDNLFQRTNLDVVGWSPAQEGQVVHHCLG